MSSFISKENNKYIDKLQMNKLKKSYQGNSLRFGTTEMDTVSSPKRLQREVRIMTKLFTVATSIYSRMDLYSTKNVTRKSQNFPALSK